MERKGEERWVPKPTSGFGYWTPNTNHLQSTPPPIWISQSTASISAAVSRPLLGPNQRHRKRPCPPAPSNPRVRPSAHVSLHPPPPIHSPYSQLVSISNTEEDEVRTLFVAGLPGDVKARDIYHSFFQGVPGVYVVEYTTKVVAWTALDMVVFLWWQPFAFAVFADRRSAIAARHALNGDQADESPDSSALAWQRNSKYLLLQDRHIFKDQEVKASL
ncbi:RNA-binding protein with multiple splicing-like protein [Drosera capensis]